MRPSAESPTKTTPVRKFFVGGAGAGAGFCGAGGCGLFSFVGLFDSLI